MLLLQARFERSDLNRAIKQIVKPPTASSPNIGKEKEGKGFCSGNPLVCYESVDAVSFGLVPDVQQLFLALSYTGISVSLEEKLCNILFEPCVFEAAVRQRAGGAPNIFSVTYLGTN